jgi:hypothetical protein
MKIWFAVLVAVAVFAFAVKSQRKGVIPDVSSSLRILSLLNFLIYSFFTSISIHE